MDSVRSLDLAYEAKVKYTWALWCLRGAINHEGWGDRVKSDQYLEEAVAYEREANALKLASIEERK